MPLRCPCVLLKLHSGEKENAFSHNSTNTLRIKHNTVKANGIFNDFRINYSVITKCETYNDIIMIVLDNAAVIAPVTHKYKGMQNKILEIFLKVGIFDCVSQCQLI